MDKLSPSRPTFNLHECKLDRGVNEHFRQQQWAIIPVNPRFA
ncbi:hypothetical protein CORMATOL_03111 [Corynebacterium matruchotii ATCC 33806]|jgi:hypothetical protein|uniref:Uncharacterized protein n=1 Tax=Corynebacterium matruchotii ATCC 33806 TaxID=566549 RepID=C0E7X0_9CORY|nr:hypothetical protein CORMATOL_03111 [Corynebacterium matruchotii ATCC 33806]